MRSRDGHVTRRADNRIGAAGATSLASALKENSTLTAIDLASAWCTPAVRERTSHVIFTSCLRSRVSRVRAGGVSVSSTAANEAVMRRAADRIGDAGAASLASALKNNVILVSLSISSVLHVFVVVYSYARREWSVLRRHVKVMSAARVGNHIGDAGATALADALKDNVKLTRLILRRALRSHVIVTCRMRVRRWRSRDMARR